MRRLVGTLYFQVLAAVVAGALLGHFAPEIAVQTKPLADGFLRLIKMLIAPIVLATIVVGISGMGDLKRVGRVGLKALVYFEGVTTLALAIGLVVVHVLRPGEGMNVDPASLEPPKAAAAAHPHGVAAILDVIPSSLFDALARGDVLQVLVFATLFGVAVTAIGEKGEPVVRFFDAALHALFRVVGYVMRLAPLGAFGAIAFAVGKQGIGTIASLGKLMLAFYTTSLLFVFVVLGVFCRIAGVRVFSVVRHLRDELFVVLGTSSSESVLPQLMTKLEELGCGRPIVRLVVPMGYSFNLDGTSIYLTMGALFVAQATNVHLSFGHELALLGVLLLTSKGAAAVTGGGFVVLAATLASTGDVPVAGVALLLGIDRFMSEARALTNLVGNAVATIVVSKWEDQLDVERARATLERTGRRSVRSEAAGSPRGSA